MVRNCLHQWQILPVSVINLGTNDLFFQKLPKCCSHPLHSCCLSPKGKLKIHLFTIDTFFINMEFKTGVWGKKHTPKGVKEFKQSNSIRNHLAVGGIGERVLDILEPGLFAWFLLWRRVYFVWWLLHGVWTVWSVSWSSTWGKKVHKTKSQQRTAERHRFYCISY